MPGMMDTILNLGLNDQAVEGLAKKTSNPRFAYDCYRRFIQMYSDVVMELGKSFFEERIDAMKERKGVKQDIELDAEDLKELVKEFKAIYLEKQGEEFPQDPKEQLIGAVKAVFRSWDNPRANVYRKMNEIPYEWGTAVNVQQMAFGNSGMRSGTGVAFTRNPATGEKKLMGEYLINAQGEDVVAGIRTPSPISKLHEEMPEVYDQFVEIATRLENYYKDMQDMEFTIEDGKLFMLQTRTASAPHRLLCRSPATSLMRALSISAPLYCALSPSSWIPCCTRSLTLLPRRLLKQSARAWLLLRDLPAVALSSALKMLKRRSRTKLGRRSFWSVWKPAPKISSACRFLRAS